MSNTFLKVMQFGQFVAHSFSMTSQSGDLTEINAQIKRFSERECCGPGSENQIECFNIDVRLTWETLKVFYVQDAWYALCNVLC